MSGRNFYVERMASLLFIWIGLLSFFNLGCSREHGVIVLTPKANQVIERESEYEILWKIEVPAHKFGASVVIEFSKDGGNSWEKVEENVPNIGMYKWKVPNVNPTTCRIRLSSQLNPKYRGTSEMFIIK